MTYEAVQRSLPASRSGNNKPNSNKETKAIHLGFI